MKFWRWGKKEEIPEDNAKSAEPIPSGMPVTAWRPRGGALRRLVDQLQENPPKQTAAPTKKDDDESASAAAAGDTDSGMAERGVPFGPHSRQAQRGKSREMMAQIDREAEKSKSEERTAQFFRNYRAQMLMDDILGRERPRTKHDELMEKYALEQEEKDRKAREKNNDGQDRDQSHGRDGWER